jgi:hypothetical protein
LSFLVGVDLFDRRLVRRSAVSRLYLFGGADLFPARLERRALAGNPSAAGVLFLLELMGAVNTGSSGHPFVVFRGPVHVFLAERRQHVEGLEEHVASGAWHLALVGFFVRGPE